MKTFRLAFLALLLPLTLAACGQQDAAAPAATPAAAPAAAEYPLYWRCAGAPAQYMRGLARAVAQPGSALAWGARGPGFKSLHPDTTSLNQAVAALLEGFLFFLADTMNATRP